ncbi:hypothetical protein [Paenibacillus piscarius]|uniref:hypothetical protein n=1 Tax=Paenibacillus piscarius TaxID=1089681 RepID=UPI001EE965CD|nr:hypothetical protein [Paenibacillus piscarius]
MKPETSGPVVEELKKAVDEALGQMEAFKQVSRLIPVQVENELNELISRTRLLLHWSEGEGETGSRKSETARDSKPVVFRRVSSIGAGGKSLFRSVSEPLPAVRHHPGKPEMVKLPKQPERSKPKKRRATDNPARISKTTNKATRPLKPAAKLSQPQSSKLTAQIAEIRTSSNLKLKD